MLVLFCMFPSGPTNSIRDFSLSKISMSDGKASACDLCTSKKTKCDLVLFFRQLHHAYASLSSHHSDISFSQLIKYVCAHRVSLPDSLAQRHMQQNNARKKALDANTRQRRPSASGSEVSVQVLTPKKSGPLPKKKTQTK